MRKSFVAMAALICVAGSAGAAEFDAGVAHQPFTEAFNSRDWDSLRGHLADDVAFHRANAKEVYVGPDAVVDIFKGTIGSQEQNGWNVKFAKLESTDSLTGKDGRVVERGEFAITAGANDEACYVGSYMMTWAPQGDAWKLQALSWQDVEAQDVAECKS